MQENESNESDKPTQDEQIREYGQVVLKANAGKHRIFLLSIIGEVEGHEQSPGNVKTTKYEHVLPQLAMAEDSCDIDGILVLLNTMGGDVEAGLAIAEMIASITDSISCTWRQSLNRGSAGCLSGLFFHRTQRNHDHSSCQNEWHGYWCDTDI